MTSSFKQLSVGASFSAGSGGGDDHQSGVDDTVSSLRSKGNSISFEDSFFGVLYTLSQERKKDWKHTLIGDLAQVVQIGAFLIRPDFHWAIDFAHNAFWTSVSKLNITNLFSNGQNTGDGSGVHYSLWVAAFYCVVAVQVLSLGLCSFVAHNFKTNRFPAVWPIRVLRVFVALFFTTLYISCLNLFLISISCHFTGPLRGHLQSYPDVRCWDVPNVVQVIISVIVSVIFAIMSWFISSCISDQRLLCPDLDGAADSSMKVMRFYTMTLLVLVEVLLQEYPVLRAYLYGILNWNQVLQTLRWLPYYDWRNNCSNAFLHGCIAWVNLLLCIKVVTPVPAGRVLTRIMLWGTLPFGCATAAVAYMRLRRFEREAAVFVHVVEHHKTVTTYESSHVTANTVADAVRFKFSSPTHVEQCARIVRRVMKQRERDEALLLAAAAIFSAGTKQFPKNAFLHVMYGCCLIELFNEHARGFRILERARGLDPSLRERFMIFVRDRERMQVTQSSGGGVSQTLDIVSYVEFQSLFDSATGAHRSALRNDRRFWRMLASDSLAYRELFDAFLKLDSTEQRAERMYRTVVERYPKNQRLLRLYASFLDEVRSNQRMANKYYDEAERLDDAVAEHQGAPGTENIAQIDDRKHALIVTDHGGRIILANKRFCSLLGYKPEELTGKNVSMLVPVPHASRHEGYLARYTELGVERVIGSTRGVDARHANGHNVRLSLRVTTVARGVDVDFVGLATVVPEEPNTVTVTFSIAHVVVGVTHAFRRAFGIAVADVATGEVTLAQLMNEEGAAVVRAGVEQLASSGRVPPSMQLYITGRGGVRYWAEGTLVPGWEEMQTPPSDARGAVADFGYKLTLRINDAPAPAPEAGGDDVLSDAGTRVSVPTEATRAARAADILNEGSPVVEGYKGDAPVAPPLRAPARREAVPQGLRDLPVEYAARIAVAIAESASSPPVSGCPFRAAAASGTGGGGGCGFAAAVRATGGGCGFAAALVPPPGHPPMPRAPASLAAPGPVTEAAGLGGGFAARLPSTGWHSVARSEQLAGGDQDQQPRVSRVSIGAVPPAASGRISPRLLLIRRSMTLNNSRQNGHENGHHHVQQNGKRGSTAEDADKRRGSLDGHDRRGSLDGHDKRRSLDGPDKRRSAEEADAAPASAHTPRGSNALVVRDSDGGGGGSGVKSRPVNALATAGLRRERGLRKVFKSISNLSRRPWTRRLRTNVPLLLFAGVCAYVASMAVVEDQLTRVYTFSDDVAAAAQVPQLILQLASSAVMLQQMRATEGRFNNGTADSFDEAIVDPAVGVLEQNAVAQQMIQFAGWVDFYCVGNMMGFHGTSDYTPSVAQQFANELTNSTMGVDVDMFARRSYTALPTTNFDRCRETSMAARSLVVTPGDLRNNNPLAYSIIVSADTDVSFDYLEKLEDTLYGVLYDAYNTMINVQITVLIITACIWGASLYYYALILSGVAYERIRLFDALLLIPRRIIVDFAVKPVRLSDEDDENGGNDEEDLMWEADAAQAATADGSAAGGANGEAGQPGGAGTGRSSVPTSVSSGGGADAADDDDDDRVAGLGQRLVSFFGRSKVTPAGAVTEAAAAPPPEELRARPSRAGATSFAFFLAPLFCGALAVSVQGSSVYLMKVSQQAALYFYHTNLVMVWFCAVQFWTQQLAFYGASVMEPTRLAAARASLVTSANALLYHSSASTSGLLTPELRQWFFGVGTCFRWEAGMPPCLPITDPTLGITRFGMDAMIRVFVQTAIDFAGGPQADFVPSTPAYGFINIVSLWDMMGATDGAVILFEDQQLSYLTTVRTMQNAVLPIIVVGQVLGYYVTKPFQRVLVREAQRVSGLMARLPRNVDVERLVEVALGVVKGTFLKRQQERERKAAAAAARLQQLHAEQQSQLDAHRYSNGNSNSGKLIKWGSIVHQAGR